MLETKENEFKITQEIVNEFEITIKESLDVEDVAHRFYYTAIKLEEDTRNDTISYEGYLKSKISPLEIYHALTSEKRFFLNDDLLASLTIYGSEKGEDDNLREFLAFEHKCPTNHITVKIYKNDIYRHEKNILIE